MMEDLTTRMARLRRPRLLIDAARHAQAGYDRTRDLPPLIGTAPGPGAAIMQLLEIEDMQNAARRGEGRAYRAARHVAVLAALMEEAQALRPAPPSDVFT